MTTLREAAQQALEALDAFSWEQVDAARIALRAALAQPAPEPVAWMHTDPDKPRVRFLEWRGDEPGYRGHWIKTPLYTAPPQRKPLTEEEITDIWNEEIVGLDYLPLVDLFTNAVRAVEAAHGIIETEINGDKA